MIPKRDSNEKFTYADYQSWPEDERWEIIEGEVWDMSPAPNTGHQSISMILSGEIYNYLKDKPCQVFVAPFDVRLREENDLTDKDIETVVQPDISVICDKSKIDKKGCLGAPDIVIEILSPSTAFKDESHKLKLYERYGVKEYLIVNPEAEYIVIYRLERDRFNKPEYLKDDDIIKSNVLQGLKISLPEIFM
ncbi:MAG: Uma2 family endonuclease [Spirochaetota bacterium]|nr:Uma2 family endonuclease [Spirochaetota bacterium]